MRDRRGQRPGLIPPAIRRGPRPELGLRANLAQFSLLVGVNALVGGMVGQERTILPLLARRVFHLEAFTAALTFIVAFGVVKAVTNLLAGTLSDRLGRKPLLVAGWVVGLPVPLLLIWAPAWAWVVLANALLGVNQGLTWSTTVIMKIDLVGPRRRGFAMGLNEASGYGAVALTAMATGFVAERAGLRPEPFFLGVAFAGLGLGLSALFVRETRDHAIREAEAAHVPSGEEGASSLSTRQVFVQTTLREHALSACSQAGLVNNLNDGMAWGLFPLYFTRAGLSVAAIGVLAALYPGVWAVGQLLTGALSDRIGRKWLIAGGMWVQAVGIGLIAATRGFGPWAVGAVLLGAGTAMVYPTLLAAIGDVAHPRWRASAVGVYRLWRDAGFAIGAILAGTLADAFGPATAIWTIGVLTAISGVIVAVRMYETRAGRDLLPVRRHSHSARGRLRTMAEPIPTAARRVVEGGALAHVVTLDPDGTPQVTLAWAGLEDDEVVLATLPDQRKLRNLRRDPRVAVSFETNQVNAYGLTEYLVLYGTARVTEGGAPELLQKLASTYIGPGVTFPPMPDPPPGFVIRITVERIGGVGPWTSRE